MMSRNITGTTTVITLDNEEFRSIFTNEVIQIIEIFRKYGHDLRIAGGAVRDLLMNVRPRDIDFATTATVHEMRSFFTRANIHMLNPNGEKHGTITVHINNKNFEITTLRIDKGLEKLTDISMWVSDASRRDLTINAMFVDFNGTVYDYFNGYDDLMRRRVIFVGDASLRIKEDYLRILRYFRFCGSLCRAPFKHQAFTLETIQNYAQGLSIVSGERIWSELKKILSCNYAEELMLEIIKCNIGPYCGLAERPNVIEFKRACATSKGKLTINPISLITALSNNIMEAINMHERLKLSLFERDLSFFIIQERNKVDQIYVGLNDYKEMHLKRHIKREFIEELLKYSNKESLYMSFKNWNGKVNEAKK
uniref:Poly A polymerase head domain-containing protein n=1 Tax=Glossina brevipalpis TaxID=37001 RepID=A0A1A9WKB0_9MUSC